MPTIYLARHGQDEDNKEGILNGHRDRPLTDIGVAQGHNLGEKIRESGIQIDHIYSSPLQRAYRTAYIISDILGMGEPTKMDLLIERDFGIMTGERTENIEKMCAPDVLNTPTITYFLSPEGAETFPELLERAKKILTYINENNKDQSVLLITHGDIGKMLYAAFYGLDWREVLTQFHFGNTDILLLSPDSLAEDTHVFKSDQYNH